MLTDISQIDTQLFTYLNSLGSSTWDTFWVIFTNKRTHIPLMILLLVLTYKIIGQKKFVIAFISIVLMAIFTDQITNLAKHSFLRLRPCNENSLNETIRYLAIRCGRYSFFSGHSSNSMALAIMFGLLLKPKYSKAIYLLIFWALCMGYSRIYIGVHYPGDVLTGFTFGLFSGFLFYKLYTLAIQRFGASINE